MDDKRMMRKDHISPPSIEESDGALLASGGIFKKGPWTPQEDAILVDYVKKHGEGNWNAVQKHTGLSRCGKSCRLRWANHLRPNLKKGAFTAEEEQLIIELHARMGNKWARMAAHLPGRTDNEIKNYWNTRIKRRLRAGLPLYPPSLCFQALNYNQENRCANDFISHNKRHDPQGIDIMDEISKVNQGDLPCMTPFPEISMSGMLSQGFGSQESSLINPVTKGVKRLQESELFLCDFHGNFIKPFPKLENLSNSTTKVQRTLGLEYCYDPGPICRKPCSYKDIFSGSHAQLNGNFCASKPFTEGLKSELPSFQFQKMDPSKLLAFPSTLEAVETLVHSAPSSMPVETDCSSPHNSGLLEELLHESNALCGAKEEPPEKFSTCSTPVTSGLLEGSTPAPSQSGWGECEDPISPLGQSVASVFSESNTPVSGISFSDFPLSKLDSGAELFKATDDLCLALGVGKGTDPNLSRPDALLENNWLKESSEAAKNQLILNEALASLLGEDFYSDFKDAPVGTSSTLDHDVVLGSSPWNNMPCTFQMFKIP